MPLTQRIIDAAGRWLSDGYRVAVTLPGGWWTLVALIAVAVAVASAVVTWTGPVARTTRARALASPGRALRASDHRREARALAEEGEYATAICEYVRAIAAELDERGVLPPRTGRTADEFAEEASQALPGHAGDLRWAARLFDEICYGKRAGTPDGCERMRELDDRVRTAVPARRSTVAVAHGTGPGVTASNVRDLAGTASGGQGTGSRP